MRVRHSMLEQRREMMTDRIGYVSPIFVFRRLRGREEIFRDFAFMGILECDAYSLSVLLREN
jgi:hypothetical protein